MATPMLDVYRRLTRWPGGRWLFSRLVCWKAPYFASIVPRIESLEPGRGIASIAHRRKVSNHIGTVHAIALCNLAEFVGGLTCEVSIPHGMRWIPKGMQVQYLAKARGPLHAVALPAQAIVAASDAYALPVVVSIRNHAGDEVFQARIDMWLSPVRSSKT